MTHDDTIEALETIARDGLGVCFYHRNSALGAYVLLITNIPINNERLDLVFCDPFPDVHEVYKYAAQWLIPRNCCIDVSDTPWRIVAPLDTTIDRDMVEYAQMKAEAERRAARMRADIMGISTPPLDAAPE